MLYKSLVATVVALALAGSVVATGAAAKGQKVKNNQTAKAAKSHPAVSKSTPPDFGASGPYIGMKYIGNVP
jgi:hypothetical protein